jgi:NAD(P)-dependent dehydrogenase (short-subunit alcohol dehydrogenase family)
MSQPSAQIDLSGRTALVTGASSGLGAQFVRALAAAGAKVVAGARRLDRLQALAEEVRAAGGAVEPVALDVEREDSIIAAYDAAEKRFGTVDVVVANAGGNAEGLSVDITAEAFDQLMRLNISGVFLTAREGARRLIASPAPERGRVILIGSIASFRPLSGLTPYSVSKAGVAMMAKGLAREWGRAGITVNALCPGWIATEINDEWLASDGGQKLIRSLPRRRAMQAQDLEGLLLFLASDASASISGAVIAADEAQAQA